MKLYIKLLNISNLSKSLNFYPIIEKTSNIPQVHYYGLEDKIVPNQLQISYKNQNIDNKCIDIKSVNATHDNGWEDFWSTNSSILPNRCS